MTVGILSTEFYLIDNWPGEVTDGPNPSSWTTASATEDYPLGTKRMIYDDTNNGWATLMFLKFVDGAVPEATIRDTCGMHTAAAASGDYFCVNDDGSEVGLTGPIAIALASVTTAAPYAWFWVGGVCPEDTISGLNDGAFITDGGVTAQSYMVLAASSSYAVFHLATNTDCANFSAFSLVTDTTA
jgi:hypothetical protein